MSDTSSKRRPLLKTVLALAAVALTLEIGAYLFIVVLGKNYYLPLELADLSEETIPADLQEEFSSELGWEPDHTNEHGYRGEAKPVEGGAIAVFGDKYTFGHPDIEKSWAHLLEERLGQPVFNFGVGAYGPDQAYLRFEHRYADQLETPYVALVMMSGAAARVVNRYRGFYVRGTGVRYPKPMFQRRDDGDIEVLPNPLEKPEDLARLGDPAFLEDLGENDYWFDHYERYGLNEQVHFPYAYHLAKALPYYVERWRDHAATNQQSYQAIYQDEDAAAVLRFIIQTFIDEAEAEGAVPIFVMLPNQADVASYLDEGSTSYAAFFDDLVSIDHAYVYDGLSFFQPDLDDGLGLRELFQAEGDDSLTAAAERLVSEGMLEILTAIDQEKGLLAPADRTAAVTR